MPSAENRYRAEWGGLQNEIQAKVHKQVRQIQNGVAAAALGISPSVFEAMRQSTSKGSPTIVITAFVDINLESQVLKFELKAEFLFSGFIIALPQLYLYMTMLTPWVNVGGFEGFVIGEGVACAW